MQGASVLGWESNQEYGVSQGGWEIYTSDSESPSRGRITHVTRRERTQRSPCTHACAAVQTFNVQSFKLQTFKFSVISGILHPVIRFRRSE